MNVALLYSCLVVGCAHLSVKCFSGLDSSSDRNIQTQWFLVHAIVNLDICRLTYGTLYEVLKDPMHSMDADFHADSPLSSQTPMGLVLVLHVYHMLLYKLSKDDVFHHLLFITFLTLPGFVYRWGILGNFQGFFMCGLPGGMIYALLALQRIGYLKRVNEPHFSMVMNAYVRLPGVICSTSIALSILISGMAIDVPYIFFYLQLLLAPFNAIYYAHQSVQRSRRRG